MIGSEFLTVLTGFCTEIKRKQWGVFCKNSLFIFSTQFWEDLSWGTLNTLCLELKWTVY